MKNYMGKEVFVWSHCDPQQCWVELWTLWRNSEIKTQLCHPHYHNESEELEEKDNNLLDTGNKLPWYRTSVQWGLASAAS